MTRVREGNWGLGHRSRCLFSWSRGSHEASLQGTLLLRVLSKPSRIYCLPNAPQRVRVAW